MAYERQGKSNLWYLKKVALLSGVPPEDMKRIENSMERVNFKKREKIYLPGDPGDRVYFLKAGRVKISRIAEDGRELTLAVLEPGEVFGEVDLLQDSSRESIAETLDDTWVCVMKRPDFMEMLERYPEMTLQLSKWIGFRLKRIESRIQDLVFKDVPARLAGMLLQMARRVGRRENDGIRISGRITHLEMANLIGSTRETVTATLSEFRRHGLLRYDGKDLLIVRESALADLSSSKTASR